MMRQILHLYRYILYCIFKRKKVGVLTPGIECSIEDPKEEINHGDVVHPCVRYSEKGCLGHKWWMVYTPYYKANAKLENPILCFSDAEPGEIPIYWNFFAAIKDTPRIGYNSDPNIILNDNSISIFWRQSLTDECNQSGVKHCTKVTTLTRNGLIENKTLLLSSKSQYQDNQVSPVFFKECDGYTAYAMSLSFRPRILEHAPKFLQFYIKKLLLLIDLLGISPIKKSNGVSVWKSSSLDLPFEMKSIRKPKNRNHLYQPWHIDAFDWDGERYAVIQSNQSNADLLLAKLDGEQYTIYNKPLITNQTIKKVGIYKATALVEDGIFILYYTAQEKNKRGKNNLYVTSCNFTELLRKLT